MPECDWAGNWGQAGVASLRPDPDLDLDLRVSTSHRRGPIVQGPTGGFHHSKESTAQAQAHSTVLGIRYTAGTWL